jgi:hypothetical protein
MNLLLIVSIYIFDTQNAFVNDEGQSCTGLEAPGGQAVVRTSRVWRASGDGRTVAATVPAGAASGFVLKR